MCQVVILAMTVTFYSCADAPNVLDKTLTNGTVISTCQPCEPCDFLSPSFIMDKASTITGANYCTVGEPLNRNYFITDIQLLSGNRVLVSCAVDVLTTYSAQIKNCTGTFTRSEKPKNKFIQDSKFPLTGDMTVKSTLFDSTPFSASDSRNYILTVVGGGS